VVFFRPVLSMMKNAFVFMYTLFYFIIFCQVSMLHVYLLIIIIIKIHIIINIYFFKKKRKNHIRKMCYLALIFTNSLTIFYK